MNMNGEKTRLDPDADGVCFEPRDWSMCPMHFGIMHHRPTGNQYFVEPPEGFRERREVSIFDFTASLVVVADDQFIPSRQAQIRLGQAAIAVFLQETGLWIPFRVRVLPARPRRHPRLAPVRRPRR